jgi:AcrR family transcriptional regulator
MPQVLKAEVRERILGAALAQFAKSGYAAATMSDIARGAGMAVANLYRYYSSKEELFEAAVPRSVVARFDELLERSVHAHATLMGLSRPGEDTAAAAELLEFWIEQRLVVVVLLDRAEGSAHEGFAKRFVERLVTLTLAEIERIAPGVAVPAEARLVLGQIFENTRRLLGVVLESYREVVAIRRALTAFRTYQVAGIAALARDLAAAK